MDRDSDSSQMLAIVLLMTTTGAVFGFIGFCFGLLVGS